MSEITPRNYQENWDIKIFIRTREGLLTQQTGPEGIQNFL
jgi:hypothetical protein